MTTTDDGAVSWGAVIAGAVGAAALSLVLFLLGTGLGLAVVSPWASERIHLAVQIGGIDPAISDHRRGAETPSLLRLDSFL